VARFAPAFVRRLVEVALVGSCIVGSAVPASATSWRNRRDVPVVRAPAAVTTTTPPTTTARPALPTTTAAAPTPRPTAPAASTAPSTTPPAPAPSVPATPPRKQRSRPVDTPEPAAIPHASRRYTVRPGDNLWSIARATLGGAADAEVAPYWDALIAANRSRLRSGDPNLIYPGEVLGLPDRGANQ
jgi:nucleoid-associated protein YgaU